MTHFGLISVATTGPLNTMLPLGQELQRRGHRVTLIAVTDVQAKAEAADIPIRVVGAADFPRGTGQQFSDQLGQLQGFAAIRHTTRHIAAEARMLLRESPAVCRELGIEALLVNQGAAVGGTIADHLNIPFITVCSAVILNEETTIPPCASPWPYNPALWSQVRNQVGYWIGVALTRPINQAITEYRQTWQLPPYRDRNALYSPLLQISQLPAAFEFPRQRLPPWFHFTGPFHTSASRAPVPFPWEQLDPDRPLIYASMGTLQNRLLWVFEAIAAACADLDVQLVLSLGGSAQPEDLPALAGSPLVVPYAPQLELLQKASLAIIHAGMNTTMECLMQGVPMVAIPVTNDQPGVSTRIVWSGAGERVLLDHLDVPKLRTAVRTVLENPAYHAKAQELQAACRAAGGVARAADLIEEAIATGQPVVQGASHFGTSRLRSPHPPTPSPKRGEGEPDSKSLSPVWERDLG